MSLYVLDTDIMTLYQHGHARVTQLVLAHRVGELSITVISVEEELTGWYTKLRQVRKRDQLARVYNDCPRRFPFLRVFKSCRSTNRRLFATKACVRLIATSARTICGLRRSRSNTARPW